MLFHNGTLKLCTQRCLALPQDSAAFVRIWKKGDLMLFTGTVQISREPSLAKFRLDPMDNTTLVLLRC